ncbi:MAG TPA: hypothetical protein PKW98_01905 [Candidatus Wallbacteria bacterium]|nr:hypothetical protein [Candidatus Wallbacteria bacterium]
MKKCYGFLLFAVLMFSFLFYPAVSTAAGDKVEVLIFSTPSCQWCEKAKPLVEQAREKYGDRAEFIEADLGAGSKYGVKLYPTYIVGGEKIVGYSSDLAEKIGKIIEAKSMAGEKNNDGSKDNGDADGGNNADKADNGAKNDNDNKNINGGGNEVEDGGFDLARSLENAFSNFFKDLESIFENMFKSLNKKLENIFKNIEKTLDDTAKEIADLNKIFDGNNGGDNLIPNNDDGKNNVNDGGVNNQQGNKDDDFPDPGNNGANDGNVNNDINSGKNIGSNPWDILNRNPKKPQDDNGRNVQNQGGNNQNVNPPAPPVPQPPKNNDNDISGQPQFPPIPPLPPNNNNQNVNNNFKDPFDEMIKQQNRQMNGDNTPKDNTVDNRTPGAKELIKQIQEKFGITIVDGEAPKYVWTEQELKTTMDILSELPQSFVRKTLTLAKGSAEGMFPGMSNIGGFASGSSITITPLGLNCDYRRVLIHEMGHCFHFQTYELQNQFQQKFWSGRNGYSGSAGGANPPAISQYGGSNVMEDMAEAIAYYVVYGKSMRQMSPERYELVKNLVMEGKEW